MFEPGGGKRRNWRNDGCDFVDKGSRAVTHPHTAKQTNTLHIIASATAGTNSSDVLACAIVSAFKPTRTVSKRVLGRVRTSTLRSKTQPTKFPANAMSQLCSRSRLVTLLFAHAITIMLLPVKSSCSSYDDQDQPQAKSEPAQQSDYSIGQRRRQRRRAIGRCRRYGAGGYRGCEYRAKGDKSAAQHAQHQQT